MTPGYWSEAKAHLSKKDKTLKKIISHYEGELMVTKGDAFFTLARAIAGQQISTKAAATIWGRLQDAVKITPLAMANADSALLRACGLSSSKVIYMHALAGHFLEHENTIKNWPQMSDADITKELVSIKGIGQWTAEMFLIFHLMRPNVLPLDDLGLLKGISVNYFSGEPVSRAEAREVGDAWSPYRSVATWYIWRSLDPLPVDY